MKIALIGNDDFSMWHFRRGLIHELGKRGHEVCLLMPSGAFFKKFEDEGIRCIPLALKRFMNPASDVLLLLRLVRILKRERFDLVHTMTIKPNIYGTLAATFAGIPRRVCLISGLGFMFANGAAAPSLSQRVARLLYRLSLKFCSAAAFQNRDDLELFVSKALIERDKAILILSSGVNTDQFSRARATERDLDNARRLLSIEPGNLCVTLIAARLIWSKGVAEFVSAARALAADFPLWRFILVAPRDDASPDSVSREFLSSNPPPNLRVIDVFQTDILPLQALSDIAVLPSFYPEGVPRSLLEALSLGVPVITTNTPGCRETVIEGKNGFLVPPRDAEALARKLAELMKSAELRKSFGRESRILAEGRFSEQRVVEETLTKLYEVQSRHGQVSALRQQL